MWVQLSGGQCIPAITTVMCLTRHITGGLVQMSILSIKEEHLKNALPMVMSGKNQSNIKKIYAHIYFFKLHSLYVGVSMGTGRQYLQIAFIPQHAFFICKWNFFFFFQSIMPILILFIEKQKTKTVDKDIEYISLFSNRKTFALLFFQFFLIFCKKRKIFIHFHNVKNVYIFFLI